MAQYAKDFSELESSLLVKWDGRIYAVWDDGEQNTARLVPYDVLTAYDGDEKALEQKTVSVPIRQIQIPEPVKADQDILRSFFRLDVMPWDLLAEGRYPFSSATCKYAFSEEDLFCLLDRLTMFRNSFLLEAWRDSYFSYRETIFSLRIRMPKGDPPGFTLSFFASLVFGILGWMDPGEDDLELIRELRDCYLRSKGKPLAEMVLPDYITRSP